MAFQLAVGPFFVTRTLQRRLHWKYVAAHDRSFQNQAVPHLSALLCISNLILHTGR